MNDDRATMRLRKSTQGLSWTKTLAEKFQKGGRGNGKNKTEN